MNVGVLVQYCTSTLMVNASCLINISSFLDFETLAAMRASVSNKVFKLESVIKQHALSLKFEVHKDTLMHLLNELLRTIPSYPHQHTQVVIGEFAAPFRFDQVHE